MSMISAQCDELRAMAGSVGLAMPQAATLMMDAADAIDRLDAENAKLRELVLCLLTCSSDTGDACDRCPVSGGAGIWDFEDFCDSLLDRVHELEIEVGK